MQSKNLLYLNLRAKDNRLRLFFCFVIKGVGLELRSALQLRGKAEAKVPFPVRLLIFFWAAEEALLSFPCGRYYRPMGLKTACGS